MVLGPTAVKRLRGVFNDIDKDNSGSISIEEFTRACMELSITVSAGELEEFMQFDASGDTELDFDEFYRFYSARMRKVFDEIDTDGSGEIEQPELKRAFKNLGYKATDREVWAMLARVDTDNNQGISFEEFCNYFCSMPSPSAKAVVEKWSSGLSVDTGVWSLRISHGHVQNNVTSNARQCVIFATLFEVYCS